MMNKLKDDVFKLYKNKITRLLSNTEVMEKQDQAKFPFVTRDGKWLLDDKWSNAFFAGQLWLLYEYYGDEIWLDKAKEYTLKLAHYKAKGDFQDIGYLFLYSFVPGYRITSDEDLKKIALEAAENMFDSCMKYDYLKCNWLEEGDYYVGIDSFMNIGLWIWAFLETREYKYKKHAEKCINKAVDALISSKGNTYEYRRIDKATGESCDIYNKNAKGNDTIWARGHSWAIYGLVKWYECSREDRYLKVIELLTDVYVKNTYPKLIPAWDLMVDKDNNIEDSSAAAIAASAFLQLANASQNATVRNKYRELGSKIIENLKQNQYINFHNDSHEGILLNASTPFRIVDKPGESQIWGDYFLLEAVVNLAKWP